ncbi:MAG: DUF4172 domain-containing protein [Deltaproteobacteria bacterium]|jgi:Fic family protein|nr:DUF4172 domain-containing protein [Deltaproteobacteria bacterium]
MFEFFWQSAQWPRYHWQAGDPLGPLAESREFHGRFPGRMANLGFGEGSRPSVLALEEGAVQTADIERERLDREIARSSIAQHLGFPSAILAPADRIADGLAEAIFDDANPYDQPLERKSLSGWRAALFSTSHSSFQKADLGFCRDTATWVGSGLFGEQNIRFNAPPPEVLSTEMKVCFSLWRERRGVVDGLSQAALAHLYFVTTHVSDDASDRLSHAFSDLTLAQGKEMRRGFYNLSSQSVKKNQEYYHILERTEKNDGACVDWLFWLFDYLKLGIRRAGQIMAVALLKPIVWQKRVESTFDDRQNKILNILFYAGLGGFEGGVANQKYIAPTKISHHATGWRKIDALLKQGLLPSRPYGGHGVDFNVDNTTLGKKLKGPLGDRTLTGQGNN